MSFDNYVSPIVTTVVSAVAGAFLSLALAFVSRGPALQRIVTEQMKTILDQKDQMIEDLQKESADLRKQIAAGEDKITRLKNEVDSITYESKQLSAQLQHFLKGDKSNSPSA